MAASLDEKLFEWLLRTGDNTLILSHRLCEWCGHAPVLEEDIAIANTALDLIGQTQLWLDLASEVEAKGRTANDLAYLRDVWAFRNVLLVERPNGDMAFTLMRQFLFDTWHKALLCWLTRSTHARIAEIAAKAVKEVAYHFERSASLVIRLGDGTDESHRRMERALVSLWPYTGEFFENDAVDQALLLAGIVPDPASLKDEWEATVAEVLSEATLAMPQESYQHGGGRQGIHTEHLGFILAEMQFLQRAYPALVW